MTRRRLWCSALAGIAAIGAVTAGAAHADAPVKDGWWTDLDQGSLDGSPALGVPAGGLQVANGPGGATAVSAVTFSVPDGATVGALTLTITGHPLITSPPVACAIAANSLGYQPAAGGPMSAAPVADCTTKVTGTVDAGMTTVTFAAAGFAAAGQVAVLIEAGGPADSITFAKPDDSALAVGAAPPPGAAPSGGATAGVPSSSSPSSPSVAAPVAAGGVGGATVDAGSSAAPTVVAVTGDPSVALGPVASVAPLPAAAASAAPAPATSASRPAPAAAGRPVQARRAAAHRPASTRRSVATVLGLAALLLALVAWTEGYGLLGGRLRTIGAGSSAGPGGGSGRVPAAAQAGASVSA